MGANLDLIKNPEVDQDCIGDQTIRCKKPNLNIAARSRLNELKAELKTPHNTDSNLSHVYCKSDNVSPISNSRVRNRGINDRNYKIKLSEFILLYKGTIVSKYNAKYILTPESSSILKNPNITWIADSTYMRDTIVIKTIQLEISNSVKQEDCISKLKLLRNLDSPFIPRIYEFYIENNLLHICMEKYQTENLKNYIARKGPLKPAKISQILFQLAYLLKSLHKDELIIQAINLNDILLIKQQKQMLIKVTNIESIVKFKKSSKSRRVTDFKTFQTGQFDSFTPAIRKVSTMQVSRVIKSYNNKGDIWCLGKILYHMISGFYKGRPSSASEIWRNVTRNSLSSITEHFDKYSDYLDLLQVTLHIDASKRFSAKRFLNVPYIQQGICTVDLDIPALTKKIRRFRKYNLIQQISFIYGAKFLLSHEQVYSLTLSYIKYNTLLDEYCKVNTSENKKHAKVINTTYTEFLAANIIWRSILNKEMLEGMYIALDSTGEGIQPLNLQKYLKNKDSCGKIVEAFKQFKCVTGCIQDYHISKEEYINIVLEGIN